ncbi:hypothetical protein BLSTO_03943 [Blastocystis sp. subtype 1]
MRRNTLHRTESNSDVVCLDSGIDVVEYDSDYRIYMDIPSGVGSSIRILQQEDGIRIEGERRVHYDGCKCVLFQHRQKGKFIVFLPCNKELVDIEHSKASVNNGELCISIAKRRLPDEGCGSFSEGELYSFSALCLQQTRGDCIQKYRFTSRYGCGEPAACLWA